MSPYLYHLISHPVVMCRAMINQQEGYDMTDQSLPKEILITEANLKHLEDLIRYTAVSNEHQKDNLERLSEDLERATVVDAKAIPPDVVTINFMLQMRDLDSGEEMVFTVVSPPNADVSQGRISLLAPVGSAVLGYRTGDVVEWRVPARLKRLKIEKVLYQPEAAGDFEE
jgi:regulator of nucleoside diphosphate kinase